MRWILVFMMPSGSLFVLAPNPKDPSDKGGLALFPVERGKENVLKGVFSFDTEDAAFEWMEATSELSEQGKKLMDSVTPMLASELQ